MRTEPENPTDVELELYNLRCEFDLLRKIRKHFDGDVEAVTKGLFASIRALMPSPDTMKLDSIDSNHPDNWQELAFKREILKVQKPPFVAYQTDLF